MTSFTRLSFGSNDINLRLDIPPGLVGRYQTSFVDFGEDAAYRNSMAAAAEVASDIWSRAIKPGEGNLPPEAARFFLGISLHGADLQRIETLSMKNRRGELTEAEERELGAYTEFGWFVDFMRSKARLSLRALEREK